MSLLVVGSVAFDTIETPFGRAERILGGSATFFAYAASYFTPVRLCGIVGGDFPQKHLDDFAAHQVDLAGLQIDKVGKTVHWTGNYKGDMNEANTVDFELNVLGDYKALVPDSYLDSEYVFLANDHPRTQLAILDAVRGDPFSVVDTRDMWIKQEPDALAEVMRRVDGMVLNDYEARLLSGQQNIVCAGPEILRRGPKFVIIKKGEHGSILFSEEGVNALPACPLEVVKDPTGAGDSYAGGLMGYLSASGKRSIEAIKRGMTHGTVAASIAVEDFSVDPFFKVDKESFDARHDEFIRQVRF